MKTFGVIITTTLAAAAAGQLPSPKADEIPKLAPPLPEIPLTYWEAHGTDLVLVAAAAGLLLGWLSWRIFRPKPAVELPPAVRARQALEALQTQPETGQNLSRVSQILRRYFSAAFHLPPDELTTTEFCQAVATSENIGPEIFVPLADFLRRCDEQKFSPAATPPCGGAVTALKFVAQGEARREQLSAAATQSPTKKP